MPHPLGDELTELHVHLGGAVDPAAMWGIAHEQGIRLPTKDYWEFVDLITVRKQAKKSFEDFLALYRWTELIQSSPRAVEESVYEVVGGAYRKANITTLELRFNPMKRNRGGERDLDHIIMASIRGFDRALRYLEPDRIGHGIHAAQDRDLCKRLAERGVLLEICPSSNLDTKVVKDADELGEYIATFKKHKVRFSFNTDGPEMLETTLREELRLALRSGWVTKEELVECGAWAKEASFVRRNGT